MVKSKLHAQTPDLSLFVHFCLEVGGQAFQKRLGRFRKHSWRVAVVLQTHEANINSRASILSQVSESCTIPFLATFNDFYIPLHFTAVI